MTVHASNDVGAGAALTQLCWPVFKGLRDWEIALLVIAPLLILAFVLVYIWKCKRRNPLTCKPLPLSKSAVAPAPIDTMLELGGPPKPLSFLNTGLDLGLDGDKATAKAGGYGGSTMFDALRSGQAVHVTQKRNSKRREKKKGGKRRQL